MDQKKPKTVKTHKKSKALFFPSEYAHNKLLKKLKTAKEYCWVCIYCLTNDKISAILWELKEKGVDVRVITDDETATNKGSDLKPARFLGLAVVVHAGADSASGEPTGRLVACGELRPIAR